MNTIVHNMVAMNANRQFNTVSKNKAKSTEKLSSGYRINRAADDAAGLSISEKMRNQIRNLNQATNNVQDGISYVQTAEGALNEITSILHRMEELSVKAANDTNTEEERNSIQEEIDQLRSEMDEVFVSTQFNGKKIWDPQQNAAPEEYIVVGYDDRQAATFTGGSYTRVDITEQNKGAIAYDSYKLSVKGTDENDPDNYGFKIEWNGWDGNAYSTDLISWDDVGVGSATSFQTKLSDHLPADSRLSGIDFDIAWNMESNATLDDVVRAVNGVSFSGYIYTSEVLTTSTSASGVSIYSYSTNYLAELASGRNMDVFDDDWITPHFNATGGTASRLPDYTDTTEDTGWEFKMELANVGTVTAKATTISYSSNDTHADDENGWWYKQTLSNGRTYTYTKNYSPSTGNAATIHNLTDAITNAGGMISGSGKGISLTEDAETGGTIYVDFDIRTDGSTISYGGHTSQSVGSLRLRVSVNDDDDEESLMNRVKSAMNENTIWDFHSTGGSDSYTNIHKPTARTSIISNPIMGVDPDSIQMMALTIQDGANSGETFEIKYKALRTTNLGIADLSMRDNRTANIAIGKVQNALKMVNKERSVFGAYQNRMEKTIEANMNYSENLMNAESAIRDADMAEEVMKNSKFSILEQAGQAMITQANQKNSNILQILQ